MAEFFDIGQSRSVPWNGGLTYPIFQHYGVELWVPEVAGAIDPESEAHDLITSVFGGMSKGERTRKRLRQLQPHPRRRRRFGGSLTSISGARGTSPSAGD